MKPKTITFKDPARSFDQLRDRTRIVQWLARHHGCMWGRGRKAESWNFFYMPNMAMPNLLHRFQPGDKVVYTNEFGVCWGIKTIKSLHTRNGRHAYVYEDMETPWSPVSERRLSFATPEDLEHEGDQEWLQETHGWETSQEDLQALGANDPFEGEE